MRLREPGRGERNAGGFNRFAWTFVVLGEDEELTVLLATVRHGQCAVMTGTIHCIATYDFYDYDLGR